MSKTLTVPHCYRCGRQPCECGDGQTVHHGDLLKILPEMPPDSVSLVFGSGPYADARTYGINAQRGCAEWVQWMLECTEAAARVCCGPVIWVVAGVTRDRCYWPGPEGLIWEWWKRGGTHELYRPCYFHRVGIPGSGGDDWFRADVEYIVCFKRPGALPWSENTVMGHPPKWAPGGEMSYRLTDGTRTNQWGKTGQETRVSGGKGQKPVRCAPRPSHYHRTKRAASGEMEEQDYMPPSKANPGNLVSLKVGGGHMGSPLAHENEAPFPEKLAAWFILSCCPPDGIVLDPFCGSGTTLRVAKDCGRQGIGIDIRESQCELTARRLEQGVLFGQ